MPRGRPKVISSNQKGDLTVVKLQARREEEAMVRTSRDQVLANKPPKELRDLTAKKEWKRILPVLESIEMLGNCDRVNLIGYCNAWSKYMEAVNTDDDSKIIRYGDEVRKFESLCYLTPDSRLKAAATKRQKKEQQMEKKFGAI